METQVNSFKSERENFNSLLINYNKRIEHLEDEKQNLNQNLEQTQTVYLANREEVDRLSENLRYICFVGYFWLFMSIFILSYITENS